MRPLAGDPVWFFRGKPCLIARRLNAGVEQLVAFDISGKEPFPEVALLSCVVPLEIQSRDLGRAFEPYEMAIDTALGADAIADFANKGLFALTGASVVLEGKKQPVARVANDIKTVSSTGVKA